MIRNIRVEQFKSLKKLNLELGRVNIFIGANGSGKSNLLEAIGVLGAAAYGRVDDETLLRRGVRPGVPRLYKSAFPQIKTETTQHILFEATAETGAFYRATLWNPIENPSPAWKFKTETLSAGAGDPLAVRSTVNAKRNQEQGVAASKMFEIDVDNPALVLLDQLRGFNIYSPNTPGLRGMTQDPQTKEPVGLTGARLAEAIDELLQASESSDWLEFAIDDVRSLLDWAVDFRSASALKVPLSPSAARSRHVVQFTDRYMAKGRNVLTGYDASEGALYVVFLAVLALHPKAPAVLAVDNFDQALNPRLVQKTTEALCRWMTSKGAPQRQMFLTAHNPSVLDGLPLHNSEIRLFAVQRNNKGHSEYERIDIDRALELRGTSDKSLSQMWVSGLLGAVPNV